MVNHDTLGWFFHHEEGQSCSQMPRLAEAWNAYLTNIIERVNDGWPTPGDQFRMDAQEFETEQMWVRSGVQL